MEFCEREYKEIVNMTESLVDKAIEKEKKHFEKNSGPYLYANIYSFMNNCVGYRCCDKKTPLARNEVPSASPSEARRACPGDELPLQESSPKMVNIPLCTFTIEYLVPPMNPSVGKIRWVLAVRSTATISIHF